MKTYKTDGQNRVIFSKDMKVAELIDADYSLLSILLRLDMQLPFGDVSVEDLGCRYGMSAELFLMICQSYSIADYLPDVECLSIDDLTSLIRYLRASHRFYLDEQLPSIGQGVERVLECCDKRQQDIVSGFYRGFCPPQFGEGNEHCHSLYNYLHREYLTDSPRVAFCLAAI